MNFKRLLSCLATLLVLCSLTGCIDLKEDYTLNPDGSGKVHVKAIMAVQMDFMSMDVLDGQPKMDRSDPQAATRQAVAMELAKAKGVDAWKDVSYKLMDDGRVAFEGTAYFPDISDLKLHLQGFSQGDTHKIKIDATGGKWTLRQDQEPPMKSPIKTALKPSKNLDEFLLRQRMGYQQYKPILKSMLTDLKMEGHFVLPCQPGKVTNFRKASGNAVTLTVDGDKILALLEKLVFDRAMAQELFKDNSMDLFKDPKPEVMNKFMFGQEGPIEASCAGPTKPNFNYASEMAQARKAQFAMTTKLGLNEALEQASTVGQKTDVKAPIESHPASSKAVKSVKLAGIRQSLVRDDASKLRAFEQDQDITLSIQMDLDGAAMQTDKGTLTKAVSSDGENLLGDQTWNREIWSPRLSEDKRSIIFETSMGAPKNKKASLAEVSGTITYLTTNKTKEVDLGFTSLEDGSEGKTLSAKVSHVDKGWSTETAKMVTVDLAVNFSQVKEFKFIGPDGKPINGRSNGYSGGGETSQFTFEFDAMPPPKSKVIAVLYDNIQRYEAPFTLKNIRLFQP